MATRGSLSLQAISSYSRSTYYLAAALAESRVSKAIAGVRDVVWSPEGGKNDFGILVAEGLEGNDIRKLVHLTDAGVVGSKPIVPLDVKLIMPQSIYGSAMWFVHLTQEQIKTCQALIITTPKEPDYFILLPVHYLRCQNKVEVSKKESTQFWFRGVRPAWTLHPVPAFPPKLTPFISPFSGLQQILADMRDYATGSATQWYVPFCGLKINPNAPL